MKQELKKSRYVLCRYNGDNGDLVVGLIESVRNKGTVVLTNLITGAKSLKEARVLVARNVIVPKSAAMRVVKCYVDNGIDAAKKLAIEIVKELEMAGESVRIVKTRALCIDNDYCSHSCTYKKGDHCVLYDEPLTRYSSRRGTSLYNRCHLCKTEEVAELVQPELPGIK